MSIPSFIHSSLPAILALLCVISPSPAQPCEPTTSMLLVPADGTADDWFSYSVAVDGDTAVIGAWKDSDAGDRFGSAYVYVRSGDEWVQEAKLFASDGHELHRFGWDLDISGDTIVVGAWGDNDDGNDAGAAYIFTRSGTTWTQQAKLSADDASGGSEFGVSVAIDSDTVVIGATGSFKNAAYVFTRDGTVWSQEARLTRSTVPTLLSEFGYSLDISEDTIIVGDYFVDDFSGAAYIFTRDAGAWTLQSELQGQQIGVGDTFGLHVAIDEDTAIIGAYEDDNNGARSGTAFIFHRIGSSWDQQAWLLPGDGSTGDFFGLNVGIDGDRCVIGAVNTDDPATNAGSVYLYARSNGVWYQQDELYSNDPNAEDKLGSSIAISGTTAVAGMPRSSPNGPSSGSAMIFELTCLSCPSDLNGDGTVDFFDFNLFLNAYNAQDPLADFTRDNEYSFFDVALFLQLFNTGCP